MLNQLKYVLMAGLILWAAGCSSSPSTDQSLHNGLSPTGSSVDQKPSTDPVPTAFHNTLSGTIDGKYDIQMELEREGGKLKGTYFYKRPGAMSVAAKYIMLEGDIDPSGNATLAETDFRPNSGKSQKTGEFKGLMTAVRDNEETLIKFSGTWTRTRDGKSMPFALVENVPQLGASLKLLEEKKTDQNKSLNYDIQTALPRLKGADATRAAKFNQTVDGLVSKQISEFKQSIGEESKVAESDRQTDRVSNSLETGHSITSSSEKYISILFTFFSYTGGAHPNANTVSLNYDLEKGAPVKLDSLFKPGSNYLKIISDYCITELTKLKVGDADWIKRGAGPDAANFKSWNIAPEGLVITFDAYQVASYAEGPQEVVVPYTVLKEVVKPGGLLSR